MFSPQHEVGFVVGNRGSARSAFFGRGVSRVFIEDFG
jgi:hypothetical protein